MAETVQAQCGSCHKRFRLRADQLNREVRCPHCKTIVKIAQRSETASAAVGAFREMPAERRPAASSRPGAYSQAAMRNKNVGIAWLVLVVLGLIGAAIGLFVVFGRHGDELMPEIGARRTGPTFERDQVATTAPPDGAAPQGTGPAAMGPDWKPPPDPIEVKVERILRGYKDETVTYAAGHVTNNTDDTVRSIKIVVDLFDKDEKPLGQAVAVILNIPPKYTVPLVAEWKHAQGVRARRWMISSYETNPPGIPRELPPLQATDPWPKRDPNSVAPDGVVSAKVTNLGLVPVRDMDMVAILLDATGQIVGAARSGVTKEIQPKASEEVSIRWELCAGTLVQSTQVWVQPQF